MLLASGGGLILADLMTFSKVYALMSVFMLVGVVTTLLAPEPGLPAGTPRTLGEAVVKPFVEFFQRHDAWLILAFILLYKVGDTMASHMTTPFYLDLGFSKTEIGAVVKLFGFWATILGSLLGGVLILRVGIYRSLWIFGVLQAASTAGFAVLAGVGPLLEALADASASPGSAASCSAAPARVSSMSS